MSVINSIARGSCLIGLIVLLAGCVVVPRGGYQEGYHEGYREGYYDRPNHRYWHDDRWHDCREDEDDAYCH